ncbi:hypothetical protein M9H77_20463 [Catharanthus roseus]|uniref:Uncharacterized protein n=1 Tax=Catharanthus roseus TaxID=4058 RepID=A0ACC0AL81_CATRO|nr:hypothetical protein M9H77_20463 [Catharanthus roseus]
MGSECPLHIFLVSFPGQGHFNPLLRFGRLLASKGLLATLSAPELIGKDIRKANDISDDQPIPVGPGFVRFEFFDDEVGSNFLDLDTYLNHLEIIGKQKLPRMLKKHEEQGRPISCLIVNPFLPWVSDVAESLNIPSATLWVQSCASFSAYYHYHHRLVKFPSETEPEIDVQLPGLPLLKFDEIPSFLHPKTPYPFLGRAILRQFSNLSKNLCVLMDTFFELETEEIESISKLCPVKSIGPLFKASKVANSSISGDIIKADDCKDWLDSKPNSSVVYISFGSVVTLKQEQVTELAYGLLNSEVSFLWVIRPPRINNNSSSSSSGPVLPEGFLEKIGAKGKIVQWSPQEQVLCHPSIACFLTHCGWNSTLEAISSGVPIMAFPQWGDQVLDAKYLVDVFKIGLRMCRGEDENRIIPRDEIENCLREATIGPKAEEMKENALKWKNKAEEAVAIGGSSHRNIQDFLDEINKKCSTIKR